MQEKIKVAVDAMGGDNAPVEPIKAAVEAGTSAASKLGELVATHVIPRPHSDVEKILPKFKG